MEHQDADSPQGNASTPPIGARLKAAREARGLGLGEVADRLKLSLRQLEAIESDRFSVLPGPAFVRGFVRNYARFLELDPEPLLRDLEAQFPSSVKEVVNLTKEPREAPRAVESSSQPGAKRVPWLGLVLVAVVAGGLAWWLIGGRAHREVPAQEPEGHLAPMLTESSAGPASAPAASAGAGKAPAVASAPAVAAKPAPTASAPTAKPAKAAPAAAVPAKPAASAPSAAPSSGAAGEGSARIVAKTAAWVAVTDADGKRLMYQMLGDGQEKTVTGKPPFKVVLGNAPQVQVYFNGQPVDFASKIKGNTAKIELK